MYTEILRRQLPRLVGFLDRSPASPTYGCLDRNYWHLKLVTDFPSATYQQATLALAWVAVRGRGGVAGLDGGRALEWARAAMRFWARLQHSDGSFDEWYSQEHSYCATAFTTFAISEALLLLRDRLGADDVHRLERAVERAAGWLARRESAQVANQNMAALNALHNAWLLAGEGRYRCAAEDRLDDLLRQQDAEGWFPEYGGADLGYSLLATDLLAHYWKKTQDARVWNALDRLVDFIGAFMQPDGTVADCGSRATGHLLPYGLELLAHGGHPTAERILSGLRWALAESRAIAPEQVDDRYFAYFYVNSYVGAAQACAGGHPRWSPGDKGTRVFRGAGLGVFVQGPRAAVVSLKRNGMLRLFLDGGLALSDAGYQIGVGAGRLGWTCGFAPGQQWTVSGEEERVVVRTAGPFYESKPVHSLVIPLKLWARLALRSGALATRFHGWLRSREVASLRPLPIVLEREIRLEMAAVTVTDRVVLQGNVGVVAFYPVEEGGVAHSPSAGFGSTLPAHRLLDHMEPGALLRSLLSGGAVTVTKVLSVDGSPAGQLRVNWR